MTTIKNCFKVFRTKKHFIYEVTDAVPLTTHFDSGTYRLSSRNFYPIGDVVDWKAALNEYGTNKSAKTSVKSEDLSSSEKVVERCSQSIESTNEDGISHPNKADNKLEGTENALANGNTPLTGICPEEAGKVTAADHNDDAISHMTANNSDDSTSFEQSCLNALGTIQTQYHTNAGDAITGEQENGEETREGNSGDVETRDSRDFQLLRAKSPLPGNDTATVSSVNRAARIVSEVNIMSPNDAASSGDRDTDRVYHTPVTAKGSGDLGDLENRGQRQDEGDIQSNDIIIVI
jgi:hypothetical protein